LSIERLAFEINEYLDEEKSTVIEKKKSKMILLQSPVESQAMWQMSRGMVIE